MVLALASQLPDQGSGVIAAENVLVAALVVLISGIHAVAREGPKALTGAALVFNAALASLIFFNNVVHDVVARARCKR